MFKKRFREVQGVSELAKLKDLAQENAKLKRMYANLSLEHETLKMYCQKNDKACQ